MPVEGFIVRDKDGRHLTSKLTWHHRANEPGDTFVHPKEVLTTLRWGELKAGAVIPATVQSAIYERDHVEVLGKKTSYFDLIVPSPGSVPVPPPVVNRQYADAYLKDHLRAELTNTCPYCEDQRARPETILRRTSQSSGWWTREVPKALRLKTRPAPDEVTGPSAKGTYVIVPTRHITWPHELTADDMADVLALTKWLIAEFQIPGAGLALRFDVPDHLGYSGRTITHLHFHLIDPGPAPESMENPSGRRARIVDFPIG